MSYNYYSDDSVWELLGFMFSTVWFMIMLVILAFTILISWKIFEKFGEPGWKSLIPIYNIYIMFKYTFGSGLWIIALMVPILNFIVAIMFAAKMAKVFGKSGLFAVGLFFLPFIFQAIIAFDDSRYMPLDTDIF